MDLKDSSKSTISMMPNGAEDGDVIENLPKTSIFFRYFI